MLGLLGGLVSSTAPRSHSAATPVQPRNNAGRGDRHCAGQPGGAGTHWRAGCGAAPGVLAQLLPVLLGGLIVGGSAQPMACGGYAARASCLCWRWATRPSCPALGFGCCMAWCCWPRQGCPTGSATVAVCSGAGFGADRCRCHHPVQPAPAQSGQAAGGDSGQRRHAWVLANLGFKSALTLAIGGCTWRVTR